MYEAYHEIVPVHRDSARAPLTADIVGPVCESGDCFARDRVMPAVAAGDLVAFMSAGAYGFSMAGRYNTRPMPAEVMISGSRFGLVNQRESFETMVAGERIPDFLTS
jgi:diaminopimelate decarboxylase